ncbi:MAG TPA: hypothetical protein VOA41_02035 [Candidatus Dormibacteraeota bacterium]|nr:hypothetical protein [Candidatus Dormibacteraeota bacterium]
MEQIKQNVYRYLMGETFSERELSIHDISTHLFGGAAWDRVLLGFRREVQEGQFGRHALRERKTRVSEETRPLAFGARPLFLHAVFLMVLEA